MAPHSTPGLMEVELVDTLELVVDLNMFEVVEVGVVVHSMQWGCRHGK